MISAYLENELSYNRQFLIRQLLNCHKEGEEFTLVETENVNNVIICYKFKSNLNSKIDVNLLDFCTLGQF